MTAACNFISLGEEMRELLDKNGKERKKEKRKMADHMIGQKQARNLRVVSHCFLAKLNEADKAGSNCFNRSTRCT